MEITEILNRYWGYPSFRPMQEEIIHSAMDGKDTLALLPTGGGKSICYQVPGLAQDGVCLVISPLIALMKDQVLGLMQKGVYAKAIVSGMDKREIDITLDNCIYGKTKFLYVSPERLKTEIFQKRFEKMNVNLIAVDEAHCISQWGYDFRPSYKEIGEIRELAPDAPILALTATATPAVVDDIQEKLLFKKENVFRKSFRRENLAYVVLKEEDKHQRLLRILKNVKGSGIVYVRNRRKTREISDFLNKNRFSADFYHAGVNRETRDKKQADWLHGHNRVIVSTNAFGMGIDKPDVRFVAHWDIPDSPEAYFQEAGRGGRDEKKSYAVLLHNEADIRELRERVNRSFPSKKFIKRVYEALGNYFRLAFGSGEGESFPFDATTFSDKYDFKPSDVHHALKILELDERLVLSPALQTPSRLMIRMNQKDLYSFQVSNRRMDSLIKLLLRTYPGLFDGFTSINEEKLAAQLNTNTKKLIQALQHLDKLEVVNYVQRSGTPTIFFSRGRVSGKDLKISTAAYEDRKKAAMKRLEAMEGFVRESDHCRSQHLLAYFGEKNSPRCGICDVCLERNKLGLGDLEFQQITERIQNLLKEKGPQDPIDLPDQLADIGKDKIAKTVRWMVDNKELKYDGKGRLVEQ